MVFPELLTITVTDEDARKGKRLNCTACPTVFAIERMLPETCLARVFVTTVDVTDCATGEELVYALPQLLQNAIRHYDQGNPFTIGTYLLTKQHGV